MQKRWKLSAILLASLLASGCSMNPQHDDMEGMHHSVFEEFPPGMKPATNPAFSIGSQATLRANHMAGMYGAKATIDAAYDTYVYSVSYTPVTGGAPVKNHKWVVQEEIKDAGTAPFQRGDQVRLSAGHMPGMKGAVATVDTVHRSNVYEVDYTPSTGGARVKNHRWVTEQELDAR